MVGLPVVDSDQNVIGIITESDIAKACLPGYYKELQNPSSIPDFDQFSKQYVGVTCHVFIFSYFSFLSLAISGI
jgi:CBS domain-containing protein